MPAEQEQFQDAVIQILEAVMFENWLRFYFIQEQEDAEAGPDGQVPVLVQVPDKGMERIKELYPHLLPLAEDMNGRQVDFETSRRAVCTFVLDFLDGKKLPKDMAAMVFESATFQVQLQLFNTWVQMHEDQLDETFAEFGSWRKYFFQWKETEGARELAQKLAMASSSLAGAEASTKLH